MILSKAYKEIMDKVQVDAAMHERILTNVQKQPPKHRFSLPKIMRITSLAACLLLCIGFAGLYPWQKHTPAVLPPSLPHIEQAVPEPVPLPQTQPTPEHSKQTPSTETPSSLPQQVQQSQAEPAAQQTAPEVAATTENALQLMGAAEPQVHSFETDDELARYVGFDVRDLNNIPFWIKNVQYQAYDKNLAQITYSDGKRSLVYRKSPGRRIIRVITPTIPLFGKQHKTAVISPSRVTAHCFTWLFGKSMGTPIPCAAVRA